MMHFKVFFMSVRQWVKYIADKAKLTRINNITTKANAKASLRQTFDPVLEHPHGQPDGGGDAAAAQQPGARQPGRAQGQLPHLDHDRGPRHQQGVSFVP